MDLAGLSAIELPDATGGVRRLGGLWAERRIVLVFLRHFGWLHCREHAAQLRGRYDEIRARGGDVVAVGTGDVRYARDFVARDAIPFPVLVDDDGRAARAAAVPSSSFLGMFHPRTWRATRETWRRGFRIGRAGKRVTQLGASFVIGPGAVVRYAHLDRDSTDHAPVDALIAAL